MKKLYILSSSLKFPNIFSNGMFLTWLYWSSPKYPRLRVVTAVHALCNHFSWYQENIVRHLNFHDDKEKKKKKKPRIKQINVLARNPSEASEYSPNNNNMKRWKTINILKDINMENTIPALKWFFAFDKIICNCVENFKTGIIHICKWPQLFGKLDSLCVQWSPELTYLTFVHRIRGISSSR